MLIYREVAACKLGGGVRNVYTNFGQPSRSRRRPHRRDLRVDRGFRGLGVRPSSERRVTGARSDFVLQFGQRRSQALQHFGTRWRNPGPHARHAIAWVPSNAAILGEPFGPATGTTCRDSVGSRGAAIPRASIAHTHPAPRHGAGCGSSRIPVRTRGRQGQSSILSQSRDIRPRAGSRAGELRVPGRNSSVPRPAISSPARRSPNTSTNAPDVRPVLTSTHSVLPLRMRITNVRSVVAATLATRHEERRPRTSNRPSNLTERTRREPAIGVGHVQLDRHRSRAHVHGLSDARDLACEPLSRVHGDRKSNTVPRLHFGGVHLGDRHDEPESRDIDEPQQWRRASATR